MYSAFVGGSANGLSGFVPMTSRRQMIPHSVGEASVTTRQLECLARLLAEDSSWE